MGDCRKFSSIMGFDGEMSFCFRGSPKFEQKRVLPSANYDPNGFEFMTCRKFIRIDSGVHENRMGGYNFSGHPMVYADDLFLNGKILPLKLKLPPCKQGGWGTGTPVPSPSPSPRSPLSPGAVFPFRGKCVRNDDIVTDPFLVALENVKCDKKSFELDDDCNFDPFESTSANRRRLTNPRGVEFAQKLRFARLAEEMKETGTEAVSHVPKRRIRNFFSRSKRSVLQKLRIEGSLGRSSKEAKAVHMQKSNRMVVVKYKPNKILLCLGYGGKSIRYS